MIPITTACQINQHNVLFFTNFIIKITGLFYTTITEDHNCELRLKTANFDHEKKSEYQLQIKLDTLSGLVSPSKSVATVSLHVMHQNSKITEPRKDDCVCRITADLVYTHTPTSERPRVKLFLHIICSLLL
jgi:hypothetical protein